MTLKFIHRRTVAVLHQLCMCFSLISCLPFILKAQGQEISLSSYNHGYNYNWSQSTTHDSLFFSVWVESPGNPVAGFIGADLEFELDTALPSGTVVGIQLNGSCLGATSILTGQSALENPNLILSKGVRNGATGVDAGGHVLTITIVCPIGTYPVTNPQVALGGVIMVENVDLKWAGPIQPSLDDPKVWPLPAANWANIAWQGHSKARLSIVDAQGRMAFHSGESVELPYRLPLRSFLPGRYWILLEGDGKRASAPLLVKTNP